VVSEVPVYECLKFFERPEEPAWARFCATCKHRAAMDWLVNKEIKVERKEFVEPVAKRKGRKCGRKSGISIDLNALRRIRAEKLLTVSELARKAGITACTLGNISAGYSNPSIENFRKIVEALGYTVEDNPLIKKE
jgi:DNA-binding XRE family transcriptional regulator